jgi:hypothetical protein
MKKIYTLFIASILMLGITSAAATIVPQKATQPTPSFVSKTIRTQRLNSNTTTGNFTGIYAIKNETGYQIQGQLDGTWEKSWSWGGTLEFHWNNSNNTMEGDVEAYFFGHIYIGQINITGTNTTGWIAGLFRVNETTNEFVSVALIYTNDYYVRYAIGTID